MATISSKQYRCTQCGHVAEQSTNHWGPTWSYGHTNCCPNCPPHAKYQEFGGQTIWECMEKPPLAVEEKRVIATKADKKEYLERKTMNELFERLRKLFGERMVVDITHGSMYRDYVSFHFGVADLDVEDVYRICAGVGKAFAGMEITEVSIQPGRAEGNVWVQSCHELCSTNNNQI